jgi:hypothetical protein
MPSVSRSDDQLTKRYPTVGDLASLCEEDYMDDKTTSGSSRKCLSQSMTTRFSLVGRLQGKPIQTSSSFVRLELITFLA